MTRAEGCPHSTSEWIEGALPSPRLVAEGALRESYLDHLESTVTGQLPGAAGSRPLAGLRVVLDAGNGAASSYAGELFERLGAAVTLLCAARTAAT